MRTQGSFSCRRQTFLSKAYKVCHLHRSMNAFILNMMLFFGSLLFLFRYFLSFWRSLVLSLFGTAIISGLLLFFLLQLQDLSLSLAILFIMSWKEKHSCFIIFGKFSCISS